MRALQQSADELVRALQGSPTTVFGQDPSLRYLWTCSGTFGRGEPEIVGKTDADLFPDDQAERLAVLKRRVLATGVAAREVLALTVDGSSRPFDMFLRAMTDHGEVVGLAGVATDLTGVQIGTGGGHG